MKGLKSKNKMVLLLSIFLVLVLCVGAASAASDTNVDDSSSQGNVLTSTDDVDNVIASTDASSIGSSADKGIVGTGESKNFTTLNNEINGNTESVVDLEGTYTFNSDSDSEYMYGILITRDITIDGHGKTTIDGNNLARAFYIADGVSNVVLQNINIRNTYADNGAVVYSVDGLYNLTLQGVTVSNTNGTAIYVNNFQNNAK